MRTLLLLLCVVAALGGLLAREALAPATGGGDVAAASTAVPQASARAAPGPDPAALALVAETVLARPLFSPTRKPPAAARAVAPAAPAAEAGRLSGIIITPDGGIAIFSDPKGKPRVARTGDSVGQETVGPIRPGQLTLQGADGARVVRPTYVKPADAMPADPPRGGIGLPMRGREQ